jgi:hypothetical protein
MNNSLNSPRALFALIPGVPAEDFAVGLIFPLDTLDFLEAVAGP